MEFKGTKGEWNAVRLEATDFYEERSEIHYSKDGECVAEFVHNHEDAKLIAAAPELLEALKVFVDFPEEDLNGWIDEGTPVTMTVQSSDLYNAINAIIKALK